MPRSIERLIFSETTPEVSNGQFYRMGERPTIPPHETPFVRRDEIEPYLDALHGFLAPGDQKVIRLRIEALLEHWNARGGVDAEVAGIAAADWLRVLYQYPAWAVIEAANWWIDNEERRPQIAGIKRLCDDAVYEARLRARVLIRALEAQQ